MKVIKIIIFSLFLLISLVYLFIIVSPKVFKGFYPFGIKVAIVSTGSMEPTLKINDFVVVKKPKQIQINDIISYKEDSSDIEVLHRVIKINDDEIITKGDANNIEDKPITSDKVTGIYVTKIKYFGNMINFIKKPVVFSLIITFFVILMLIPSKDVSDSI